MRSCAFPVHPDPRSQTELADPPGPTGPATRGGFCGKPPPGDSRSLLRPPAPPPPGDSGLLLTTVQPWAAQRPAPRPALAHGRSRRQQRQRLATGSPASDRQGGQGPVVTGLSRITACSSRTRTLWTVETVGSGGGGRQGPRDAWRLTPRA